MVCIYCRADTQVTNSRLQVRRNSIWRRRKCGSCGAIFSTSETVDLEKSISVRRKTSFEPFQRDKLLLSIHTSLRHRPSAIADAAALTETIISKLLKSHVTQAAIDCEHIKHIAYETLNNFDNAAAVSYQAFHQ